MASPIVFGQGLAGTGVTIASAYPDLFSNNTIWVNNSTGSDANAGTEPELPVKTTAQAVTNAVAGGNVVFVAGNLETISSTVTVNKAGLHFIGFGVGTGRASFLPSSGATPIFTVTAANCIFEGFYFRAASATSGTGGRITTNSSGTQVLSCQVDCGAFDQEGVLFTTGADNCRIESTTFTAVGSRPTRAVGLTGTTNTNCTFQDLTVNGATFGWAGNAVTVSNCVSLVLRNFSLQGNSDLFGSTTTSYRMFGVNVASACKVTLS